MNPPRLKAYLLLLFATLIWAVAEPVIKYTLGGFSPLMFLTYRFGISAVISIVTFLALGFRLPKDNKTRLEIVLYGFVTTTLSLGLLFFGLDKTTVLDTVLISLAGPLLISFVGVKFLNEHVTTREKIGMAIAFVGTLLTVVEPFLQNRHDLTRLSGNILIVFYLIATAWGAVLAKKLLQKGVDPLSMTNLSFIVGFLSLLPFALPQLLNSGFQALSFIPLPFHLGVIYMAVFSGTIAYFLSNKAQKTIEIGEASVFNYLYPLFAAPLAVIWLKEKTTPLFIFGAVIIAVGVLIAEIKKKRVASEA
jgi:drug/metabolite transporter (DMT)-like permease